MKTLQSIVQITLLLLCGCAGQPTTTEPASAPPAAATKAADANAALDALTQVNAAQSVYFKRNRRYALAFDELVEARDLKSEPGVADTGYLFRMRPAADAQTYTISAAPAVPPVGTPARTFFTDQSGVIRGEDSNKPATAQSPVVTK